MTGEPESEAALPDVLLPRPPRLLFFLKTDQRHCAAWAVEAPSSLLTPSQLMLEMSELRIMATQSCISLVAEAEVFLGGRDGCGLGLVSGCLEKVRVRS